MTSIHLSIPGEPVAKGRPRFTRGGHAYTPSKTRYYEWQIQQAARRAMNGRAPLEGPLAVNVQVFLHIPASWSKKKRVAALAGTVLPIIRPDIENFSKGALDGMNGIVYRDDSQVVSLYARKNYAAVPGMEIWIEAAHTRRPPP